MQNESLTFPQMVVSVLQAKAGQQLNPTEIANLVVQTYPDYANEKTKNTTQQDFNVVEQFRKQFHAGIKKWMEGNPQIKSSEETPRTYWWEGSEIAIATQQQTPDIDMADAIEEQKEKDLYPLLATYLVGMKTRKLYPMRIDEKKASNTNGKDGNKYLYPDLVALEDLMPLPKWKEGVRQSAIASGAQQSKLWSFEVKLEIQSVSEARKYYLQAISNSSWANFGYLVATKISSNAFEELKLFHELHGIGVIQLDLEDPANETVVKLAAREREGVDWNMCNRIACQNTEFEQFLGQVAEFHKLGKTRKTDWYIPAD